MINNEVHRPLKVSITGIDGAGKSTVTDLVSAELGQEMRVAKVFRPVYTVIEGQKQDRYQGLLRTIDRLHKLTDRLGSPQCVLGVNALNVVLQGRVIEPDLIRRVNPELVVGARDFLIDPAVYAIFYSKTLAKRDIDQRIARMQRITGADFRDVVFFLTVPPEEAIRRIDKRMEVERTGSVIPQREKWRHLHEHPYHLGRLQNEYYGALNVVTRRSQAKIYELDTSRMAQDEVAETIVSNLRSYIAKRDAA